MVQKDFYLKWLENWFGKRVDMPADAVFRNFFVEKWIDSFQTLELILEMESEFHIKLDDSVLSDSRFSSISGLSDILFELKSSTSSKIIC